MELLKVVSQNGQNNIFSFFLIFLKIEIPLMSLDRIKRITLWIWRCLYFCKTNCIFLPAFTGFETNNKYEIRNSMGQRVYMAVEDTCCCTRNCCGSSRPFDIKVMDNQRKEVMHLERPLRCECCLCFCCLQVRNELRFF